MAYQIQRPKMMSMWLAVAGICLLALTASTATAQFVADDFHDCALGPVWTFVDPAGDGATAVISGAYTDNAHLAISVPGGVTHEIWGTTIGAPHVLQPLVDADFTAEVKFSSVLPSNYAQQGLLVRESSGQWLRLEFYRTETGSLHIAALGGPTTVFFDSAIAPAAPSPLYMRVARVGNTWTLGWSGDGVVWQAVGAPFDYTFLPNALGIYAGNRGANPPAHTVQVDWIGVNGDVGDDVARNTLTVDVVGGGLVSRGPDQTNYACGDAVTITATDQPGWVFSGWSGDLTGMTNPASVNMNGPLAITATFTSATVDTLFAGTVGGGSVVLTPPGGIYNRGTVVSVTAVDGPGWVFDAWSGDLVGSANPQNVIMNGNRTVTAAFTAVPQHSLTVLVQPGSAGSVVLDPAGGIYNLGTTVVVHAVPDPGWAFSAWSGDLTGAVNPDTLVIDGDKNLTATFDALPNHTLTTTVSGSGQVILAPDQPSYLAGSTVTLTATPDSGWRFTGWSGDLSGTVNPTSILMNADKNVHAVFSLIPPVIATDDFNRCALGALWTVVDPLADGGGAVMSGTYSGNARVAISVPGGIEHEIWNGFIGAPHILQPAENVNFTIEAKFDSDLPGNFAQEGIVIKESETRWIRAEFFRDEINRMRIAIDRGPNVLTHDVVMPAGLVPPLWMRVTRTGDTFVQSWSTDGTSWTMAGGPFSYAMTVTGAGVFAGNRGVSPPAHTVLVDYIANTAGTPAFEDAELAPLAVNLVGAGLVNRTLDLATYGCNQVETLTAVDQPGWAFVSWSGAVTGTQNPINVTMNGAATVTAHFTAVPQRTLTATVAAGNGSVVLSPPGGVYNDGAVVLVSAVPDFDWEFMGWSGDLTGTANPDTLVMSADMSVSATFQEIIYAFVSDDFHACTLDPAWTFVNPRGDAGAYALTGAYTDDARLSITVPGGVSHELWNGAITAPYVIQPALNVDFSLEVKFDSSLPNAQYAQEGVIVRQDDANWLRFEFVSDGPFTRVFAALPDGSTTPIESQIGFNTPYRMRVSRLGDSWHVAWSANGVTWNTPPGSGFTYALNVTGVGVYAGNNGFKPAHTVLVDYFKHRTDPWPEEDTARAPLTVTVVGSGSVLPIPPMTSYACGQSVTLTPVAAHGWVFAGWSGDLTGSAAPAIITMSGPASVTATFTPLPVHSLAVNVSGSGGTVSITPATGPYYLGDKVVLTAVDGPGWAFSAWSGDLTGAANPDTVTINADTNITAIFVPVPQHAVTVSVPAGNGTVVLLPSGGLYNQGARLILTATGDEGFALDAWSGDLVGSANPDTIIVDAAKNIVATFAPLPQFALTPLVAGQGSIALAPAGGLYYLGTSVVLTATPDVGWRFDGWSGDLTGTANPDSLVMGAARTVTANFSLLPPVAVADDFSSCTLDPRWVVVDPFGDGGNALVVNAFSDSARVAISVPGGFEHEIWNGIIGATHILQTAHDRDFTLEAKFDSAVPAHFGQEGILIKQDSSTWVRAEFFRDEVNKLRVAIDRGPASITHDIYLPETVQEPLYMRMTRAGNTFTQFWSEDGITWNLAGAPFDYTMNVSEVGLFAGNRGIVPPAHTVLVDYFHNEAGGPAAEDSLRNRIDVALVGGGLVQRALNKVDYACGDVETLAAADQPGWVFSQWSGDVVGTQNPLILPMNGPRTLTATFTAVPQFTLAATVAAGNGSVTLAPPGGVYNQGTVVTVTAVGDTGWGLTGWSGDATGSGNPLAIVVDGDKSVAATFSPRTPYALNLETLGVGTLDAVPAGGAHYEGDTVVITATPGTGWIFGGWSGALSGQINPATLVMDGNKTLTATFLEILPVANSDDFNACELAPMWTVVDPFSDGGAAATINAFTDSAQVAISVPGGTVHEIWNGVIGSPHILQSAQDTDFVIEVRFDSLPPANFCQQGILVKQDNANWVRAEIFRDDAAALRIAVNLGPAQTVHDLTLPAGLQAPVYMRLARNGSQFTQYWSSDGSVWNQAGAVFANPMVVGGVGMFAGNRGVTPTAHTVLIDYFTVTPGAPAGEDARRNRIGVTVVGSGAVQRTLNLVDYACGQTETLTPIADPGWTFDGWTGDYGGTQNPLNVPMSGPVSVTARFLQTVAPNLVSVTPVAGACLSTIAACVDSIPVRIARTDATPIKSFSVVVALSNLAPCGGVGSLREGDYLRAHGSTDFQVVDNLDGTYRIDGVLLEAACDATEAEGVLLWVDVAATVSDGVGTITLTTVELRDCAGSLIQVEVQAPATITIDHTRPDPATSVAAAQVLSGNPSTGMTAVDVTWTAPSATDVLQVVVYRKAFGGYPEYSDAGGSIPVVPNNPVASGWQLAAILPATASAFRDAPPSRDYWYYHIQVVDTCGNAALPTNVAGQLNYLLADVAGGTGDLGDNIVDTVDVAAFSAGYGKQEGQGGYVNRLDVGPTTDFSPFALPTTDSVVDFEDLMIMSLSVGLKVGPGGGGILPGSPAAATRNFLMLDVPAVPAIGQTFAVAVRMEGDGTVQGLSLPLLWNGAVVQPVTVQVGGLLTAQGGQSLALQPQAGLIDVALMGLRERGISGTGILATVTFQVVGVGNPSIGFGSMTARGRANQPLSILEGGVSGTPDVPMIPALTSLHQNVPNPFNPSTSVSFDLARPGTVRVQIYSIDGRLVRVLADGPFEAGRHTRMWDGTDDNGEGLASGVYLLRLVTPDGTQTGRMLMVK